VNRLNREEEDDGSDEWRGCLRNIVLYPESQCPSALQYSRKCLNSETLNPITISSSSSINQSYSRYSRYKQHPIIGREISRHSLPNTKSSSQQPIRPTSFSSTCNCFLDLLFTTPPPIPPLIIQYEFLWPLEDKVTSRERQAPS
jgi:hypothetical protein